MRTIELTDEQIDTIHAALTAEFDGLSEAEQNAEPGSEEEAAAQARMAELDRILGILEAVQ